MHDLPLIEKSLVLKILRKAKEEQEIEINRLSSLTHITGASKQLELLKYEHYHLEEAIRLLWQMKRQ